MNTVNHPTKSSRKAFFYTAAVVMCCICPAGVFAASEPQLFSVVGLRDLVDMEPNLTGLGVQIAAVGRSQTYTNNLPDGNYQLDSRHLAFWGADVAFENGLNAKAGYSSHETAIAGLLLGLDPYAYNSQAGSFEYRGACPDASITAFEFWRFVSLYIFGGKNFEADILTLSLGEVFPSWWTRGIEKIAAEKGVVVIAAAGNGRRVGDPVLYPAAGSNTIAVGVVSAAIDPNGSISLHSFASANPATSSAGPTADGRCKPDIVAPGRGLIPIANSENGYAIEGGWSSLAAPVVSGAVALLMQKAKEDPNLAAALFADANANAVIKAILLTSADKLPYWHKGRPDVNDDTTAPLDFNQGAGMLNIKDAYRLMLVGKQNAGHVAATGWDNSVLNAEQLQAQYEFASADPNNKMITATLCWNRVYQNRYPYYPDYAKDFNLRLELWGVEPNAPEKDTLISVSDSASDNVEHLYAAADSRFVHYRLVVRFSGESTGSQHYAVAWTAGQEKAVSNPFWYDLNNDSKISDEDRLIYFLIDQNRTQWLETKNGNSTLHIDSNRLQTLMTDWQTWKLRLPRWSVTK